VSAIAGIASPGKKELVNKMLDKIAHRGDRERLVINVRNATFGVSKTKYQNQAINRLQKDHIACDDAGGQHFARAQALPDGLELSRDALGVMPLYYGRTAKGTLCFAGEVKALLEATRDIHELPPGHHLVHRKVEPYCSLENCGVLRKSSEQIARELKKKLQASVRERIRDARQCGSLLSGGLDSSAITALARPYVQKMHTFAAGTTNAPDLQHAREVARFVGSQHHEIIVALSDLLKTLPQVIYHLESFDALLVRSSLTHYLVAQMAADYVPAVFSGEGGDELFAGYSYLKRIPQEKLSEELLDITLRLHNTALQRVDRCTSAHGLIALVAFLDPEVVSYALRIPSAYKLHRNTEKWILRRALKDLLPEGVVQRPKAKFWEGAGVGDMLEEYANEHIRDKEFLHERHITSNIMLNSKEELMYYRIFHEYFGDLRDLSWVGRTKGAPSQ